MLTSTNKETREKCLSSKLRSFIYTSRLRVQHPKTEMSQFVIVFALLCVLQQSASYASSHNLRRKMSSNPVVGNSLPTHSHNDPAQALANIRKKLRSMARRRDSNPHFEAFSKKLDELSQKNIIPHAATSSSPDFKKQRRAKPKIKKHQNKFFQTRSGVVGDSPNLTPQPLIYDPNGNGDNAKELDGYKKGAGVIVQPKNLY